MYGNGQQNGHGAGYVASGVWQDEQKKVWAELRDIGTKIRELTTAVGQWMQTTEQRLQMIEQGILLIQKVSAEQGENQNYFNERIDRISMRLTQIDGVLERNALR